MLPGRGLPSQSVGESGKRFLPLNISRSFTIFHPQRTSPTTALPSPLLLPPPSSDLSVGLAQAGRGREGDRRKPPHDTCAAAAVMQAAICIAGPGNLHTRSPAVAARRLQCSLVLAPFQQKGGNEGARSFGWRSIRITASPGVVAQRFRFCSGRFRPFAQTFVSTYGWAGGAAGNATYLATDDPHLLNQWRMQYRGLVFSQEGARLALKEGVTPPLQ